MRDEWLVRWEKGQTGWHEETGSSALRKFWPRLNAGKRVLVPMCGKSQDLLWLAEQAFEVTGVELSEIAARSFFVENDMTFELDESEGQLWFRASDKSLAIVCGDYFEFSNGPYDALYDRAALVALPAALRPAYVEHTKTLLTADAVQLLVTLEYDQSIVNGPPFSVLPEEVSSYWPQLRRAGDLCALKNMPPKYRDAQLSEFVEAVWLSLQD